VYDNRAYYNISKTAKKFQVSRNPETQKPTNILYNVTTSSLSFGWFPRNWIWVAQRENPMETEMLNYYGPIMIYY
jgi:hypothetical protein